MAENGGGSAAEKLTYLLVGAGLGATLALLFAPKSGRELRGEIADATKRGLDAAGQGVRLVGDRATDLYETGVSRAADAYSSAREKVTESAGSVSDIAARQKDQIAAAIEAGRQAYRDEKRKLDAKGGAVEPEGV